LADESPKTREEAFWGLGFFVLTTLLLAFAASLTLSWDSHYLRRFLAMPSALGGFVPAGVPLDGLPFAILGGLQMLVLGSAAYALLFPRKTDPWEALGFAIGLGLGLTGLIATVLALVGLFNLLALEFVSLGALGGFMVLGRLRNGASFRPLLQVWTLPRPVLRIPGLLAVAWVGFVSALIVYQALFYPVVETDSLIYHAPLAAMVYHHGGLPWVVGGGVGLGSSANYPQLFSLIGATFYVWTGGVHDVYLRLLGAVGWMLTVYGTGLIGRRLGGPALGLVAGLLAASVPSFISYGFLTTQMTVLTSFGAFAFLALVQSGSGDSRRWSVLAGLFFGFAALTSYQGLYLLAPVVLLAGSSLVRRIPRVAASLERRGVPEEPGLGGKPLGAGIAVVSAALVGCAPYLRNLLLLGNPLYPFFRWAFPTGYVSPMSMELVELHIRSAAWVLVGANPGTSSWFDFLFLTGTHAAFAPLNFVLTIPALLVLPLSALRRRRELAFCYSITLLAALAGPIFFVRYLWLLIPYAGVMVAGMALAAGRALTAASVRARRPPVHIRAAGKIPVVVLGAFLLMPIAVGFYGNAYFFGANGDTPADPFRYFTHPSPDVWEYLRASYGSDASGWEWLNANLASGERVATFEYRVYYLKYALTDPGSILYLDGEEADPLYRMSDPADIAAFLSDRRVAYVFVRPIDWDSTASTLMPLFRALGSPAFPPAAVFGRTVVFHVGAQRYSVVPAGMPISLRGIEGPTEFKGRQAVVIPNGSVAPRLFLFSADALQLLMVRFWDEGAGSLHLNFLHAVDKKWYFLDSAEKLGKPAWRTVSFVVPGARTGSFLEFGLHARGSDFVVDRIEILTVASPARVRYGLEAGVLLSNETRPPALFVYLPFLNKGDRILAAASIPGSRISIDVFRGYISPDSVTGWWTTNGLSARSPALPLQGTENPQLEWTVPTSGGFTLVVSLWSPYRPGLDPWLQVSLA
jgi:hypothetical protein